MIGPLVALGVVLREPATTILFNHGRFSEDGVQLVAATLALLLLALPGEALITILVRAFYANRDTRTPAIAAILAVVINVVVGVVAVNALGWGLSGIALGHRARLDRGGDPAGGRPAPRDPGVRSHRRSCASACRSRWRASPRLPSPSARSSSSTAPRRAWPLHARALVQLVLGGGLGGLAYLAITRALRLPELGVIMRLMSDTLSRLRPA